jgi:hypothetical protein
MISKGVHLEELIHELDRILTSIKFLFPHLLVTCKIDDPRQTTLDTEEE